MSIDFFYLHVVESGSVMEEKEKQIEQLVSEIEENKKLNKENKKLNKELVKADKKIEKLNKKLVLFKKIDSLIDKVKLFFYKNYLRFGIILMLLSILSVVLSYNKVNVNETIKHIGDENLKTSLAGLLLGFIIINMSNLFFNPSYSNNIDFKSFVSRILEFSIIIFPIYCLFILLLYEGSDRHKEFISIITKYKEIVIVFSGFSLTYYIIKILDWIEIRIKKIYIKFLEDIPDSKDRMTVVIAILGTIISLIALFK